MIERKRRITVKLSEEEYQRWVRASLGEPLAVYVRMVMNALVRETLRALSEEAARESLVPSVGGEAATAQASPPSPESLLFDAARAERERRELEAATIPEASLLEETLESADFDPACSNAGTHWTIPRGICCAVCGGVAR